MFWCTTVTKGLLAGRIPVVTYAIVIGYRRVDDRTDVAAFRAIS